MAKAARREYPRAMDRPPLFPDTSAEAEEVLLGIYRSMPPWRKLQLVEDANRTASLLAMAGLRIRHPEESEGRLRRRLFALRLGEEVAARVYGPLDTT